jgi:hypothetical protein
VISDARQPRVGVLALTGITCRNERKRALTDFRNPQTDGPCTGIASHSAYSFGIQETMDEGRAGDVEVGVVFHQGIVRLQL